MGDLFPKRHSVIVTFPSRRNLPGVGSLLPLFEPGIAGDLSLVLACLPFFLKLLLDRMEEAVATSTDGDTSSFAFRFDSAWIPDVAWAGVSLSMDGPTTLNSEAEKIFAIE